MFPIVPSNSLFDPNSISSNKDFVTTYNNLKVLNSEKCSTILKYNSKIDNSNLTLIEGVFAGQFLEKDLKSIQISCESLLTCATSKRKRLIIGVNKEGFIQPLEEKSSNWIRNIKLSPDVHSQNALVEFSNDNNNVHLRLTKNIEAKQEIMFWFAENISMYMAIPFLVPANIKGNNCYVCHNCHTSYESPNPLKIHLALLCGQQSMDILWTRLHYSLQQKSKSSFNSNLMQSIGMERFFTPTPSSFHQQRFSAFKPITPSSTTSSSMITTNSSSNFYSSSEILANFIHHRSLSPPPPPPSLLPPQTSSALVNAAAQIETIVSNMGASKQGHLCIYCGKVYSRKYGLKIHIRTHTGFKPLKCKFCLRPFGDPSNLNKHVRLHMQSRNLNYKCHLCSRVLERRRDLQKHIQNCHCNELKISSEKSSSEGD